MTRIITSPERIMLFHRNQSKRLGVIVQNKAGDTIPNAAVKWRSSNPDVIQVNQDGHVTAMADVGYAILTASYEEIFQQVPVAVAKLAHGSRTLEESRVRSVSQKGDQAVLVFDEDTASFQVGEIIVSEAVYGRIMLLEVHDREVHVRTEMVPLTTAFSELYIDLLAEVKAKLIASSDGVRISNYGVRLSTPGTPGQEPVSFGTGISPLFMSFPGLPELPLGFGCELGASATIDDLEIERGEIIFDFDPAYTFRLRIGQFAPTMMEIGVAPSITFAQASDNIKFRPGIEYSGSCYLKVGPFKSPPIPIQGTPFSLIFSAIPKVGIELSVKPSFPLEITGPSTTATTIATHASLTYADGVWTGSAGVDSFNLGNTVPGEVLNIQEQLETNLGPFAATNFSVGVTSSIPVPGLPSGEVNVEFFKPKAYITWKHKMTSHTLLNSFHINYQGPQWKIVAGFKTWLGLKLTGEAQTIFGQLGIFGGLTAAEFTHFEDEWVQWPKPTVSIQSSEVPYSIGLRADITYEGPPHVLTNLYQGWVVDFIAIRQGENIGGIVGSTQLNAAGQATFLWDMFDYPPGDYTVRALIRNPHWLPSQMFPYASSNVIEVTVVEPQATIEITKPIIETVWAGNVEFEANYHFPFDNIDQAEIQWRRNNTLIDSQTVQGLDGTSQVFICLLPPDATVEARIIRTGPDSIVLASDVMQLAVFPTDATPAGSTDCGDEEGYVAFMLNSTAQMKGELGRLLLEITKIRVADDPTILIELNAGKSQKFYFAISVTVLSDPVSGEVLRSYVPAP